LSIENIALYLQHKSLAGIQDRSGYSSNFTLKPRYFCFSMAGRATESHSLRAMSFGSHGNSSSRRITKDCKNSNLIISEFHHISSRLLYWRAMVISYLALLS